MKLGVSPLILMLVLGCTRAFAALIPYFKMDSLAVQSEAIVLVQELDFGKETTRTNQWGYQYTCLETRYRVLQALKGAITNGQDITVVIDRLYTRRFETDCLTTNTPTVVPLGRALLFLEGRFDALRPVLGGIKLIIGNQTYCYGQFVTNPGPLWLAPQRPEYIEIADSEPYTESLLLKDLGMALDKAKTLVKPERFSAEQGKRKIQPSKTPDGIRR